MADIDKREAELLAALESERSARIAERIAAGELVEAKLFLVAGSKTEARAQVEQAKADKLAELRAAGETREVVFAVELIVTGVVRPGEVADRVSVPSAPTFSSPEDVAHVRHLPPLPSPEAAPPPSAGVVEEEAREEPPLIETPICVQTRQCRDDDDPGEVVEGYFSVDGSTVTVTDKSGGYVGSSAMLEGENPRVVAKRLLREKAPEAESFNRRLSYQNAGLA
jgi:hypothetical protein